MSLQTETSITTSALEQTPVFLSIPESQVVRLGETVHLKANVRGLPIPDVQWMLNDVPVKDGERFDANLLERDNQKKSLNM